MKPVDISTMFPRRKAYCCTHFLDRMFLWSLPYNTLCGLRKTVKSLSIRMFGKPLNKFYFIHTFHGAFSAWGIGTLGQKRTPRAFFHDGGSMQGTVVIGHSSIVLHRRPRASPRSEVMQVQPCILHSLYPVGFRLQRVMLHTMFLLYTPTIGPGSLYVPNLEDSSMHQTLIAQHSSTFSYSRQHAPRILHV